MIAAAALATLLAAPPRVGVIAVGSDSAAAGDLQRTIELRLSASPKIQLATPAEISAALPPAPARSARAPDPVLARQGATLLQEATDAYYQDRSADALAKLNALSALHDRSQAFPTSDRVRALLWRTAVYLALKDDAQAETEALAALTLMPEVKVDLNEFKPSVRDAVDRVRARGFRTVTVVVSGLPPGATLELDDRAVTAPFKVPVGKHRLAAYAPGRRDVVKTLEIAADLSVPMALPYASDAATEASLTNLTLSDAPSPTLRTAADAILQKGKLDWLVIANAGTEPRAVIIAPKGVQHVSGGMVAGNLAAWADQRVTSGATSVAAATPAPVKTPRPPRPPRKPMAISIVPDGGFAWTSRSRTLEGKEGGGLETSFGGVGPRASVDASFGKPFVRIDAALVEYGISTLEVTLPDGSSKEVGGGSTTMARLHGGWRQPLGGSATDSPSVFGSLGFSYESHAAKDVRDPASGDLGLLTSYTRTAVEIAAGARYPLAAPLQPALHAGVIVAPTSTWSETPANTTGTSPAPAASFGWNAGMTLAPASRLLVTLEYSGSMRSVAFKGTSETPADPPITDATISESFHSVGLTAGYRF